MRKQLLASVAAAALVLTACDDDAPEEEATSSAPAEDPTEEESVEEAPSEEATDTPTETAEPTEDESEGEGPAASGEFQPAPWATPIEVVGEELGTVTAGDIEVRVYQVGTDTATEDSIMVDAETEEPLMKEGDPVVVLNYVVTYNGSEDLLLGASLASISGRYADWEYLGGMPSLTDNEMAETYGITTDATAENQEQYTLAPGESYAYGEIIAYRTDAELVYDVDYAPQDEAGESGDRQEGEASFTLQ